MKKKFIFSLILGFILMSSNTLLADGGVFLGILGGISAQKPSLEDIEFNTDTAFLYGLRAGVRLWVFTFEGCYFQAAHNMELEEAVTFKWKNRQIDYSFIGLNVKYDLFSFPYFHLFASGGFGYYTADIHNIDKDSEGGYNLGLGFEINMGENFAILGEGKFHHVKVIIEERDLNIGDFSFYGGLSYYF